MIAPLTSLPVWPIKPNWSEPLTERLEWMTSILASRSGSEQRRAARLSPRRSFEFTINPAGRARTFADLFLHRMAAEEMLMPLWFDQAVTTGDRSFGATFLPFDTTWREFQPGQVLVIHKDAFTWERVVVQSVSSAGVMLSTGLTEDWPAGSKVYPACPVHLSAESNFDALSSRVGEAQLLFTASRENDFTTGLDFTPVLYQGRPVLPAPNRNDSLNLAYQRLRQTLDGDTGRVRLLDVSGRSFTTQMFNWTVRGRQRAFDIRQLLYWLRGRQRSLWVPTFNDDVTLASTAVAGAAYVDVEEVGFAYTGGAVPGRSVLWSPLAGGLKVSNIGVSPAPGVERLILAQPLATPLAASSVLCFMDIGRLDQDSIEITHHADTNGVTEMSCAFRSFKDGRSESVAPVDAIG